MGNDLSFRVLYCMSRITDVEARKKEAAFPEVDFINCVVGSADVLQYAVQYIMSLDFSAPAPIFPP